MTHIERRAVITPVNSFNRLWERANCQISCDCSSERCFPCGRVVAANSLNAVLA